MYPNNVLSEVERQKKYLEKLPKDFQFPLFNARHAIESQRKSGYRTTAAASREIIDNSIEAGASEIHVVFNTKKNRTGKAIVTAIAFIDNGSGMIPEMARYALSWGGGTHFEEPEFIGKFGFGLPNASINQTRLVNVYTRTEKEEKFQKASLNIDDYSTDGLQSIKPPVHASLPDFVKNYIDRTELSLDHGTVVVWESPDRLTYKTPAQLKEHLLDDFGVTYRYILNRMDNACNLIVEGINVEPVDPLFLMPKGRFFLPESEGGAILVEERSIPVIYYRDPENGEYHLDKIIDESQIDAQDVSVEAFGTIHFKVVRFPLDFVSFNKSNKGEDPNAYSRGEIRKSRRGMSFVRAGREIETVDAFPRSARDIASGLGNWPLLQSFAYHWGIEVKFDPNLDEIFGITNDKQSVRPIEDFWRLLAKEEVDKLLNAENNWQSKKRKERKKETNSSEAEPSVKPTPAEEAAKLADIASSTKPFLPDHAVETAKENFNREIEEEITKTKRKREEVIKALDEEKYRRPYKIDFFDSEYGPFYRPEWRGAQIVVNINRKHPFFHAMYGNLLSIENGWMSKAAIDLLLITLSKGELVAGDQDLQLWYETQREIQWSPFLKTAITALDNSIENIEEEFEDN